MSGGSFSVTILGSGTSTGVPVPGCVCSVCTSDDPRNVRTRCSALLSFGERRILIDTATDLRQQALREGLSRIDAVLYTHSHADHIHGIDDLRVFNPASGETIPVYAASEVITLIHRNFAYIFSEEPEAGYLPRLETRVVEGPFTLFGLPVQPVELQHGPGRCLGYRFGSFAYLTDCNGLPAASEEALQDLDILVIDGLRFRPHTTHFNIPQAVAAAQRLGARRTLLTHLSHDIDHARDGAVLPSGVELAYDGQSFTVPLATAG